MNTFKQLIRYYWYEEMTQVRRWVNGIFYFLRKIPLLGQQIPLTIYKHYELKQIFAVIGFMLKTSTRFFSKALWLGATFFISMMVSGFFKTPNDTFQTAMFLWLMLVPGLLTFYSGVFYQLTANQMGFIANFNLSRQLYVKKDYVVETSLQTLAYTPYFLVISLLSGHSIWLGVNYLLIYLSAGLLFSYVGRLMSPLKGTSRLLLVSSYSLLILGGAVALLALGGVQVVINALAHIILVPALVALASWLMIRLFNYPNEEAFIAIIFQKSLGQTDVETTINASAQTHLGEGLKMQKKLTLDGGEFPQLRGTDYLNALLFKRYESTLRTRLKLRLFLIIVAGILVTAVSFYFPSSYFTETAIINSLPILFFVMYFITFGKIVVQISFVNCDSSMLFYPFYRERDVILKGFFYRFLYTFRLNSLLCGAILSMFLLINIVRQGFLSLNFFLILIFLLFSLAFLFSFHELFIYYILQPFTSDLEVVNPLYKMVSGVLYFISYLNLRMESVGTNYVLGVSSLSILYCLIGMVVIYYFGAKTFKFKG